MRRLLLACAALAATLTLAPGTPRAQTTLAPVVLPPGSKEPLSTGNGAGLAAEAYYRTLQVDHAKILDGRMHASVLEAQRNMDAFERMKAAQAAPRR